MTTMYDTHRPAGKPIAQADNLTIAAFILVFFVPVVGAIMGHVSRNHAKRAGMRPNALATWAVGLGWAFTAISALIVTVLAVSLGAAVNQAANSYPSVPAYTAPVVQQTPIPTATAPVGTLSEQNALSSAQDYISTGAFSRKGLIQQLSSKYGEGFARADAVWAVRHLHANWFAEAVRSAREYLQEGSFSRSGLIDQLSSPYGEQFTRAQATYAVNQVGL